MGTPKPTAALTFILHTVLSQVIAAAGAIITWPWTESVFITLLIATTLTFCCSAGLKLPTPWKIINVVLPTAAITSLSVNVPGWLFLIPLTILAAVYAPALWTRVPYYPTSRASYALILAELPTDRPFTFVDIGCGFGDLLTFLSRHRPHGTFLGIEVGVLPWCIGKLKALLAPHRNLSIRFQNMYTLDLKEFDYVYTFLSPAAMESIWKKVDVEMKPGSIFITNSFPVPSPADEVLVAKDERGSRIFIHRIRRHATTHLALAND
jgi:hypothetical protein